MGEHLVRHSPWKRRIPGPPIKTPQVFAEYPAMYGMSRGQRNLESITLFLAGDRANIGYGCPEIDRSKRQNHRRLSPCLFTPGLRIEVKPNQITNFGNVCVYQTSAPRGAPRSYSPSDVSSSTPSRSSLTVISGYGMVDPVPESFTKVMLPLPFATHSIGSPTGNEARVTSPSGI